MDHFLLHVPRPQEGVKRNEVVVGQIDGQLMQVTPKWLDSASGLVRPKAPGACGALDVRQQVAASAGADSGRGEVRRCLSLAGAGSNNGASWRALTLRKPPFDVVGISDDGKSSST